MVRCGRPPRELAGKVEERILDAAGKVFLERGFSGASVDEIAEVACAGKPTIYARFPSKEALFTAVIERLVRRNTNSRRHFVRRRHDRGAAGHPRRRYFGSGPHAGNDRADPGGHGGSAPVSGCRNQSQPHGARTPGRRRRTALAEFAESERTRALPAFAPGRLTETAQRFLEVTVLPLVLRALFGEDLAVLRAEIGPHAARSVAFFLAACSCADHVC